ncbi:membrane-spanning 4-domains subfamily A member 4A-like [Solea senegalensis]|uniref:Membrane-spanning 4-domains subfamily A member 4A-like n=1 Tax=Solea senegalensis TaxID=28829 RepID=A0AAV6PVG6_SOLSE|nr:membrane-spanning 4-domains subfamily A member 4A isoform X1 [Solea senegalensis]KAG7475337.1 membrane-spanning 4-domains subfamily A member 4A-like [Solea senegalensis]
MSTSISKVGDVVIITQVLPRGESAFPLQLPAANSTNSTNATQQATPPSSATTSPIKMDAVTASFLQGRPLSLGVVQIFLGVLCVLFSLTSALSRLLVFHAPLCVAVIFVASGSVAVAAGSRQSVKHVWATLISNVVSVVVSAVGVVYVSWLLCDSPLSVIMCDDIISDEGKSKCVGKLWLLNRVGRGLLSLTLVLLVLQFCVAAIVSVFSGKSIRRQQQWSGGDLGVSMQDAGVEETCEQSPNSP